MNETVWLVALIGTLSLGTMSPGPSFVMIAQTAVAQGRRRGVAAAIGMGLGGVIFAAAALLGVRGLLEAMPLLFWVFKVAGGLYLFYLGLRIWRAARNPLILESAVSLAASKSAGRSLWSGLATQLSNPKTAVVYASVFAALLPTDVSLQLAVLLLVLVFAIEAGWYSLVAISLSNAMSRNAYLRYKLLVDRLTGAAMMFLGVRLCFTADSDAP